MNDPIADRVAARFKTANWWNTLLVRERGDTFEIGVFGENPNRPGWSGLTYMMKEVNGRIKKNRDAVVKYLKGLDYDVRESTTPIFGNLGANNYVGWKIYGRKPSAGQSDDQAQADMSVMADVSRGIKSGKFKAYLKKWDGA